MASYFNVTNFAWFNLNQFILHFISFICLTFQCILTAVSICKKVNNRRSSRSVPVSFTFNAVQAVGFLSFIRLRLQCHGNNAWFSGFGNSLVDPHFVACEVNPQKPQEILSLRGIGIVIKEAVGKETKNETMSRIELN